MFNKKYAEALKVLNDEINLAHGLANVEGGLGTLTV